MFKNGLMALLLVALVCFGCSKTPEMEGKWVGKSGTLQFLKEQKGIISPHPGQADLPSNVPFTWQVEGDHLVKIVVGAPPAKTVEGKLEGKKVLLLEGDRFVRQ